MGFCDISQVGQQMRSKRIGELKLWQEEQLLMKTAALDWLRYTQQCDAVCTEFGRWHPGDVVGLKNDLLTEIEIKRSIDDLRAEFTKHTKWDGVSLRIREDSPHKFYFLVSRDIRSQATAYLEAHGIKAGLMVWDFERYDNISNVFKNIVSVDIRSPKLHENPLSQDTRRGLYKRAGSEAARAHHKLVHAYIGCEVTN